MPDTVYPAPSKVPVYFAEEFPIGVQLLVPMGRVISAVRVAFSLRLSPPMFTMAAKWLRSSAVPRMQTGDLLVPISLARVKRSFASGTPSASVGRPPVGLPFAS